MASSDEKKASASEEQKMESSESRMEDEKKAKPLATTDVIDGRIFAVDEEIEMSEEERMETLEFQELVRKYHSLAKQQRMESLKQEEQELKGDKSPDPKYYEGSRRDRLQHVEAETEILRKMDQMARQKVK